MLRLSWGQSNGRMTPNTAHCFSCRQEFQGAAVVTGRNSFRSCHFTITVTWPSVVLLNLSFGKTACVWQRYDTRTTLQFNYNVFIQHLILCRAVRHSLTWFPTVTHNVFFLYLYTLTVTRFHFHLHKTRFSTVRIERKCLRLGIWFSVLFGPSFPSIWTHSW
jgi:hypothetical protein